MAVTIKSSSYPRLALQQPPPQTIQSPIRNS